MLKKRSFATIVSKFGTVDPHKLSAANPHRIMNLCGGEWVATSETYSVSDPLNGGKFIISPYTKGAELTPFLQSLAQVPKSGLHNPFKQPERYVKYGKVMQKAAEYLHNPEVFEFFVSCIQRTMPKSTSQAEAELTVVRNFCENFSGDSVRFMVQGFSVPGDRPGQMSNGYRWPFGPVAVIAPYNFPLEIPIMQALGAVFVGNKVVLKTEATQAMPVEQFLRFLHFCGMDASDIDLINTRGATMSEFLAQSPVRMLQFTGSTEVADRLTTLMKGRIRIEDAGFDWKIMGGDVTDLPYVAWQCDQDAYAISGQKCSAQSLLVAHSNWVKAGLYERLKELAARRSLKDLTIGPVLSHTTDEILDHIDKVSRLTGARLLFGGNRLENHSIPSEYGAVEATAVFVPLDTILENLEIYKLVTKEIFGPFQVVTEWFDGDEFKLIGLCEQMNQHLTAAVVSNNPQFINYIMANTVNGTTYTGIRARTTGAPQNHWFGPAADPCAAGIGTPGAILQTWTCHREIITDYGPVPQDWKMPASS